MLWAKAVNEGYEEKYKELVNDWDTAVDYVPEPYKLKYIA